MNTRSISAALGSSATIAQNKPGLADSNRGADDELGIDGVNEFLFTLGKAGLKGAAQMIFNPIAVR